MLLRLIERQAHRIFFGAIFVPNLVLLFSLVSLLWNDAGWLYYHIFYWVLVYIPGIYLFSWLYSFLVVPIWVKLFKISFEVKYLFLLYLFNVAIAVVAMILLTGGLDGVLKQTGDYDFWEFIFLLGLVFFSVSWFMVGGWEQMKSWGNSFMSFWRGD